MYVFLNAYNSNLIENKLNLVKYEESTYTY